MMNDENPIWIWMIQNKLTTRAAADLLQISRGTINSLLNGQCKLIPGFACFNFVKLGFTVDQVENMQDKYKKIRAENISNQISILRQKKGL